MHLPPKDRCSRRFMLLCLMGKKKVFKFKDITMSRTLSTPEFEKAVLWDKVRTS